MNGTLSCDSCFSWFNISPPSRFRPAPFWSINDYLDEAEIRRQVREMKAAGFGGAFFHSRDGLGTRYFSPEWFAMVAAAIDEGKQCDFATWLYDEDRHPSLQHHGTVPKLNPAFCQQRLAMSGKPAPDQPASGERVLAWFDLAPDGRHFRRISPRDKATGRKVAFKLFSPRPWKRGWYHEAPSYVDLLNPQAIKTALRLAYAPYAKRFGKEFGKAVPGIFFDEPYLLDVARGDSYVWTANFAEIFRARRGYDLMPLLPLLYVKGPGYQRLRHDYWRTVTERFVESTTKQVADWCAKHHLPVTGHYLCEDNLDGQITCAGAVMPHYEYLPIPGVDLLCRNARNVLTMKQVSSVADQFGRRQVMSELYAVSGHSISFAELKWIADLHLALGVNFLVPHLALYSMEGRRKRDCPPTLSYHQPYWQDYRHLNDYLGRCGQILRSGRSVCPTLVLHPVSTGWATYELLLKDRRENNRYCNLLNGVLEGLLAAKRGFALGDETIMARHARLTTRGIKIKQAEYTAIVVPPSLTWFRSTFDLLMKFRGLIVVVGRRPTSIEGVPAKDWQKLWQRKNVVFLSAPDPEAFHRLLPAGGIEVRDGQGKLIPRVYLHERIIGRDRVFFLANNRQDRGFDLAIKFNGKLRELDLATGQVKEHPETFLPPMGTRCYVGTPGKGRTKWAKSRVAGRGSRGAGCETLDGPYAFRRTAPNLLPLDYAAVAINGARFSPPMPLYQARRKVLEFMDLYDKQDYQPWALDLKKPPLPFKREFALRYEFNVRDLPKSIALVLESADRYRVKVNGKSLTTKTTDWLIDRAFRKVDITPLVCEGSNRIELSARYELNTEIEDLYLAGDFGVAFADQIDGGPTPSKCETNPWRADSLTAIALGRRRFLVGRRRRRGPGMNPGSVETAALQKCNTPIVISEPKTLSAGDWCAQGYPFYAGSMVYSKTISLRQHRNRRYAIDLSGVAASVCAAQVNGGPRRLVGWAPWQVDATDDLRPGPNTIEIEVTSTLRNVMGPLHCTDRRATEVVVFGSAFDNPKTWTDEYQLVPYGLIKGARVVDYQ